MMGVEMAISTAMTAAAVQNQPHPPALPQAHREKPLPGPAEAQTRPVTTEIQPSQPVAMPPVVTALTADFEAGRVAAEAAREAYRAQQRLAAAR